MSDLGHHMEDVPPPQARRKRWWRWPMRLLLLLFLLFALLIGVSQISSVQTWAAQKAAAYLSEQLNTDVEVDRLRLRWLDEIALEGLFIRDLEQDTLISVPSLYVDLDNPIMGVLNGRVHVDALVLSDAVINIRWLEGQPANNISLLFNQNKPQANQNVGDAPEKVPVDTTTANMRYWLDELTLERTLLINYHEPKGKEERFYVENGRLSGLLLDLKTLYIDTERLALHGPDVRIRHFPIPVPTSVDGYVEEDYPFPFTLLADEVDVADGHFILHKEHLSDPAFNAPYLDFHDLDLSDISFSGDSLYMRDWTFGGQLDHLTVRASNGFVLQDAAASRIDITETMAIIEDLMIKTDRTDLDGDLTMRYAAYPDFEQFDEKVRFDLYLYDSQVGIMDILQFVKGMRQNPFFDRHKTSPIYADGRFVGTINNVNGRNLDLNLGGRLQVKGLIDVRDFNHKERTRISLDLEELTTDMATIRTLIPTMVLPEQFDRLGKIQLTGEFDGLLQDFVASGQLSTDLGGVAFEMWLDFKRGMSRSRYGGELDLNRFDLGRWTGDERLGEVSVSARISEASGLTKESVSGRLSAKIRQFEFMDYNYQNANFTGFMKDQLIEGQFSIDDEHIKLAWEGRLEIGEDINIKADGALDHLNLMALNLAKRPLIIRSDFDLDIEKFDASNVLGMGILRDLSIGRSVDSMQYLDSVKMISTLVDGIYHQSWRSAIADIDIQGQHALFRLPDYIEQYFIKYNPAFSHKLGLNVTNSVEPTDFTFDAHIKDTRNLQELIDPKLSSIKDARVSGFFSDHRGYHLDMHIPMFEYDSVSVDAWYLYLSGEEGYSNLVTSHEGMRIRDVQLQPLTVFADLQDDTIHYAFNEYSYEGLFDEINVEGRLYLNDNLWQLSLNDSELTIFGEKWQANDANYVQFGPDYIKVNHLKLTHEDQAIQLNSINDHKGLELELTSLPMSRINDIITYDRLQFEGALSGTIQLPEFKDLSTLNSELRATDTKINGDNYGTLDIKIVPDGDGGSELVLDLHEGQQSLGVQGRVVLPNKTTGDAGRLDAHISAVKMPARIIEYFIANGLSNTTGLVDADIKVSGPLNDPQMDGYLDIPASSFKVDILGTTYYADAQRVHVSTELIDLTGVVVRDRFGNTGRVSGGLVHHNLAQLGFDAEITSDEILVLETTHEDNDIYYGTCYGEVFAKFSGTVDQPVIYVRAENKPNSHFVINNDRSEDGGELNFIRFIQTGVDTLAVTDEQLSGVDLKIDLTVTPEVEVSIIIDESTRDIIKAVGTGDLQFAYSPAGEITLYGEYVIDRGDYLFTYSVGGVVPVTKPFSLQQGSKVLWTDDPYDAYLDLRADYQVLASPYNLLADQGSAIAEEARTRTDVNLDLIIQGQMFSPNITFDIEVPELVGPIKSAVDIELARIESDPTLLQAQAASLIIFGDFANNSIAGSSVSAVANTIGEWLSSQVSFYLTNIVSEIIRDWEFIDDIQVDIGLRLPSGEYSVAGEVSQDGQVNFTSSELGVSTKVIMFDRRLELGLKGDFVNDVSGVSGGQANVLNTDVQLDYVLTPDARWRLRVYTRQDQFYNSRRTRSGIGINWRRSYDDLDKFDKDVKRIFSRTSK